MTALIIRRLLLIVPTLLIATLIVFSVTHLVPSHILDLMVSEEGVFLRKGCGTLTLREHETGRADS